MFPKTVATHGFLNSPKAIAAIRGRLFRPGADLTALTYFSLLAEARQMIGDEGLDNCPIRYSDAQMISALNRGLQELGRIRPDAFYDLFANNSLNILEITDSIPAVDQTLWTDLFGINVNFYPALVYYVISQMDLTDDEYVGGQRHPNGSRAAGGLRLFRSHVLSV